MARAAANRAVKQYDDEDDTPVMRTYYTRSASLCISAIKGRIEEIDGKKTRMGEKLVQFQSGSGGKRGTSYDGYGKFETSDPELIEFLDNRCLTVGDIFGPEEYNRQMTPVEVREHEFERTLESKNQLIRELQDQLASK